MARLSIEADAFVDLGDRTLPMFRLWTMGNGLAVRLDAHTDEATMLAASELTEADLPNRSRS